MSGVKLSVGVWDALSAKLAERAGFELLFLSGFAVAGTQLGEPDFGLLTQTETLLQARRILAAVKTPLIVDGDTGHGGPLNVQRLMRELVGMGAAGVLLEDQVWPKRCGHMRDKQVIPAEEHAQKLRAAADARGNAKLQILGRTDARGPLGLDEAIRRGKLYRAAGADIIFVEAPTSREELARIGREVPGPLMANMVEGGVTPILPLAELRELGFEYVVYPLTGLLGAARALESAFRELHAKGTSRADDQGRMTFAEFTSLVGLEEKYAASDRYKP
jgi:2-methylisocitrate lyase-like PEP mutase family enzyme